ncbi:hypothetical protein [Methylotuvimicrobium sp. KM1]|uniref:hypothetical protein n=1 Tax=Methylotuvimicrobium sp. KM1 TaxID=3377707 RepID=UPI0038513B27
MIKTILLGLAAFGFTFASMTASAASDDQYPASNFQPKVVFIDKDLADQLDTSPAPQKADKKSSSEPASITEFDPKYPAAYFQPKVIYP